MQLLHRGFELINLNKILQLIVPKTPQIIQIVYVILNQRRWDHHRTYINVCKLNDLCDFEENLDP